MTFTKIRDYLRQRGIVSLQEIMYHFDMSQASAQLIVDYWLKKSKLMVIESSCGSGCGGCGNSDEKQQYRWLDQATFKT